MNDEEHKTPIYKKKRIIEDTENRTGIKKSKLTYTYTIDVKNIDDTPLRFYKGFQYINDMINVLKKINISENVERKQKSSSSDEMKIDISKEEIQNIIIDFFSNKHQINEYKKYDVAQTILKNAEWKNVMNANSNKKMPDEEKKGGAIVVPKTYRKQNSNTETLINQLDLYTGIDKFDNMHDLKEKFDEKTFVKNRCNVNNELLKSFFNLNSDSYGSIESNKDDILEKIIDEFKIRENYQITSKVNDYNVVKRELFDVLDRFTVVVDVDYGKAYELIQIYATNSDGNSNGKVSIYKGVEVNYDPAGKKSNEDIIAMNCSVLEGKTSIIYEPITVSDCADNNFEYKSEFQRLTTKSNVSLFKDDNNNSSALIEKSGLPGEYILADKVFAQKGDKNSNDFKNLISKFINFIKGVSLSEPKKFSSEHYLAKRMGDACQAIAALYLPNAILVTYDILLVVFALSIGVKHIIHSHVKVDNEKYLTLYVDNASHKIDNRIINTYNEIISYGKSNLNLFIDKSPITTFNTTDNIDWTVIEQNIPQINEMINNIYENISKNVDILKINSNNFSNESSIQIQTYVNSAPFTDNIININSDKSNENYKIFVKSLSDVNLHLNNYFLHKNYVDTIEKCMKDIDDIGGLISNFNSSISSSSSSSSASSQGLNETSTKEYVENVSKYLSSIKVLDYHLKNPVKNFTSIINTNIKPNLLKIYKNAGFSQRIKAKLCSFDKTEFETDTGYSFLEKIFLDLKKYSNNVSNTLVTKLQSIIRITNGIVLKHGDMFEKRIEDLITNIQLQPSSGIPVSSSSSSQKGGNKIINEIKTSFNYIRDLKSYYNNIVNAVDNNILYENQEKMMCLFEIYMNYNDLQIEEQYFIRNYLNIEGTDYIQEIIDFFSSNDVKNNYLKEDIDNEDIYDMYIRQANIIPRQANTPFPLPSYPPFNPGITIKSRNIKPIRVRGGIRKITRRNKNKKEKNTKQSKRYVNKKSKNNKMKLKNYTRKHK